MTRKEQARLARLEVENRHLRETLDQAHEVNCNMLYELVGLKTKLEMVELALRSEAAPCP